MIIWIYREWKCIELERQRWKDLFRSVLLRELLDVMISLEFQKKKKSSNKKEVIVGLRNVRIRRHSWLSRVHEMTANRN